MHKDNEMMVQHRHSCYTDVVTSVKPYTHGQWPQHVWHVPF